MAAVPNKVIARDAHLSPGGRRGPLDLPGAGPFLSLNQETQLTPAQSGSYLICSGGAWDLHLPEPDLRLAYYLRNDMGLVAPSGGIRLLAHPEHLDSPTRIDGKDSILLLPQQECRLFSDGSNWRTFGREPEVVIGTREVASSVASTSILLPAGYTEFELLFRNLQTANALPNFPCRVSTDGGTTWATTNYFNVFYYNSTTAAMTVSSNNAAQAQWTLTHWIANNVLRHILSVRLFPGAADSNPMYLARSTMFNAHTALFTLGGFYNANVRINALQFYPNSGNILRMDLIVKGLVT